MVRHELGKWNLDELVKNPNRAIIDKKLARIESDSKRFEKTKKSLNPKVSSGKFLKLIHDIENITEKSSTIGGYASLRYSENTQSDEATALLTRISKFGSDIENRLLFFDLWWKRQVDEKNAKRLIKSAGQFSEYPKIQKIASKVFTK